MKRKLLVKSTSKTEFVAETATITRPGNHRVKYASLVPYELETLGDRRCIIVDLDIGTLLGSRDPNQEIPVRNSTLSNPKAVERYLQTVKEKFEQ